MKGRKFWVGANLVAIGLLVLLGFGQRAAERRAAAQVQADLAKGDKVEAPRFEVDPYWPRPLPNHWVLAATIGVWVDKQDHIWVLNRGTDTLNAAEKALDLKQGFCCASAPYIMEFDQAGNVLRHWGGPGEGFEWPDQLHGLSIDHKNNVWFGTGGGPDSIVLKFTMDGKFLMQVGKQGARLTGPSGPNGRPTRQNNNHDMQNFGAPTKVAVNPKTNEAWVSDGYANNRVVVMDADTGKFKKIIGAYGNEPSDKYWGDGVEAEVDPAENRDSLPPRPNGRGAPPKPIRDHDAARRPAAPQFRSPVHCVMISNDDLVYVCDRTADRIQVFTTSGKYVAEHFYSKGTLDSGSTWDIAFSPDPEQKYLFIADGVNMVIYVALRRTLEQLTMIGGGGYGPGQSGMMHSIATDSKGNIYYTDTWEGHRVQKLTFKGIGAVARDQGVPWPADRK